MNKVNPFPVFTAPFPLIIISNLSIGDEAALAVNLGKTSLANRTERSNSSFFT